MTPGTLMACGVARPQAEAFAAPLTQTMERFGIETLLQCAAFVAQCMHDSERFTRLEEDLSYSTPESITAALARLAPLDRDALCALCRNPRDLARAAYSTSNGNRGPDTDDGWDYRGSGLLQICGRASFERAGRDSGRPYLEEPGLVRTEPADAAATAGLWWHWHGCNALIDRHDYDGLSRLVSLGSRASRRMPHGLQARRDLYDDVVHALVAGAFGGGSA